MFCGVAVGGVGLCRPQLNRESEVTISDNLWKSVCNVDSEQILKQKIGKVRKCPDHFKDQWRQVIQTINSAIKSRDILVKKGAEMVLALAPNILFRASNAEERQLST